AAPPLRRSGGARPASPRAARARGEGEPWRATTPGPRRYPTPEGSSTPRLDTSRSRTTRDSRNQPLHEMLTLEVTGRSDVSAAMPPMVKLTQPLKIGGGLNPGANLVRVTDPRILQLQRTVKGAVRKVAAPHTDRTPVDLRVMHGRLVEVMEVLVMRIALPAAVG